MKCKCSKLQKEILEHIHAEFPDDLRARVDQCPACSAFERRSRAIHGLVALKRYEKPDPAFEERCVSYVRRQILTGMYATDTEDAGAWQSVWESAFPAFRFGMAALFVALLGLHMLMVGSLPTLDTADFSPRGGVAVDQQSPVRASLAPSLEEWSGRDPHMPVMLIASNRGPAILQQQRPYIQFVSFDR